MRMDQASELTAARVVNTYPVPDLVRVLLQYGEEKFARRIAESIARERAKDPITGTLRLSAIVKDAIPAAARRTGGNPAKRTFQALRIEVNDELGALRRALPAALDLLAPGGRLAALAYHSLEDRLVKRALAERTADKTPPGVPVRAGDVLAGSPTFRLLTRGAERPDDKELAANPRSAWNFATSPSSTSHAVLAVTMRPTRWRATRRPSETSTRVASRTTLREAPVCAIAQSSVMIRPGGRSPEMTARPTWSSTRR